MFAAITVTLSGISSSVVTVNYATSDGSANAPADYLPASGTLEFFPGETSKTFQVQVFFDGVQEPNETVNLTLSGPVNATLGSPSTAVLTIKDVTITLQLREVGFSGGGFTTVYESFTYQGRYDDPHWLDANLNGSTDDDGDRDYPICYTRATTMEARATFVVTTSAPSAPLPTEEVKIWATGPMTPEGAKLDLYERYLPVSLPVIEFPATPAINAFQDHIDFFEPLTLTWLYQFPAAPAPSGAGASQDICFITLGVPETPAFAFMLSIGCVNAKGEKDPVKELDLVFGAFKGPKFEHKVDEATAKKLGIKTVKLIYYDDWRYVGDDPGTKNPTANYWSVAGMLKQAGVKQGKIDADCLGCCRFFKDAVDNKQDKNLMGRLKEQGIIVKGDKEMMMVQNWKEKNAGNQALNYPWTNVFKNKLNTLADMHDGTKYLWDTENVEDKTGIDGQNNANPQALFQIHAVFLEHKDSKKLYDPSYGKSYDETKEKSALLALEEQAIYGYGLVDFVNFKNFYIRKRDPKNIGIAFGGQLPP